LNILVVHEVNYLTKPIYEFQILPEMLSLLGHSVTVIDYDDTWDAAAKEAAAKAPRAYPEAQITLRRPAMIRIPIVSRISGAIGSAVEVLRVLAKRKTDVVLLYGLPTVGLQTLMAAKLFGVPVVFRAIDVSHELVPAPLLVGPTKVFESIVFRSVAFNIALTPHLRSYIHAYGIPEGSIRLLPSGVDAEMFSPGPRRSETLARWGVGDEDKVVLFMGTVYPFSGLDTVIEGFPDLLARHKTVKLLIVGAGSDEVRLRALSEHRQVSQSVIFTGMQPYAILPDVIRASDVCINPFELNGITRNILPTKLFQYMACGKPVLATSLPGTRTFLAGEEQGVVYAELADFNAELGNLLSDKKRMNVLGQRGREAALQYDWRNIAATMASWLEEAAHG